MDELSLEGRISFLNVGTKILLKDMMDQYVRTLGDYKTHYAPTMSSALRIFSESQIHVVITEVDLGDGSAFRLVRELGGSHGFDDDLYIVLALEERSDALMALAEEMEAHAVLVKPFSAADLKAQIERYKAWRLLPKEPWQLLVREAQMSAREKKFREAETHFKDAVMSAPNNPIPLYRTGMYYMSKPDFGLAEGCFKKALNIKENYIQAISALGSVALLKHDLEKAETFFRRAQELSPLNPDRQIEMVRMYLERCVDSCKNSLRMDPGNIAARFNLGKLFAFQKDFIGTVRELEKVLPSLKDDAKTEAQTYIALARKLGGLAK